MKYALIKRPAEATLAILKRKAMNPSFQDYLKNSYVEAIGISQGTVLEILVASDIAEKASGVVASELTGMCPQHITCLVVVGDTAAVEEAMKKIKTAMKELG